MLRRPLAAKDQPLAHAIALRRAPEDQMLVVELLRARASGTAAAAATGRPGAWNALTREAARWLERRRVESHAGRGAIKKRLSAAQ